MSPSDGAEGVARLRRAVAAIEGRREAAAPRASGRLPLAFDKGTDSNSPRRAGETQTSSGGDTNQTITAVITLSSMCLR